MRSQSLQVGAKLCQSQELHVLRASKCYFLAISIDNKDKPLSSLLLPQRFNFIAKFLYYADINQKGVITKKGLE